MVELRVRLRPLTEEGLAELLEVAVADAEPAEVLAPVAGSPGWTAERRRAFLEFHRVVGRYRPPGGDDVRHLRR